MKHLLAGLAFLAVCSALVAPPIVVGLSVLRVPLPAAVLLVATLLGTAAWRWWPDVTRLAMPLTERPVWLVLWLFVGLGAGVQNVRLGRFMLDASRGDDSVLPWQPFFRQHSCLTAYTEAARLLPSGANVYDPELYKDPLSTSPGRARRIGPFEVDGFEYPPPFLLLPRSFVAAGVDFFTIRSGWFALQELLLLGTMALLASWIGGQKGHSAGLLIPLLLAAPSTLLSLQIGNFQLTAISLGILALIAFDRERPMLGGFALGFAALAKIYPGVLGLFLLGPGRWRALLWTLAASVALVLIALATFGTGPFVDFIVYQLPRINSGEAFFWIEFPSVAVINMSIYGLVTKLRLLGLAWTDKAIATAVCHVYVLVLLPLAGLVVWRLRQASSAGLARHELRLRHAQTWLALLNLASLRSPFVPAPYATFGSLWLLTLLAAERGTAVRQGVLALLGLAFCLIIDEEGLPPLIPPWLVGLTLGIQLSVLALNVWIVQRPVHMVTATQPAAALA